MAKGTWIRKVSLIFAGLLVIASFGSILLMGQDIDKGELPGKSLEEKWAQEEGNIPLLANTSVSDLLKITGMSPPPKDFHYAPVFKLRSISGETMTLEQFSGKTVLLGFWTTW